MKESLIRKIYTSDNPALDVLFYNENPDRFVRHVLRDPVEYDRVKKEIEKRGLTDSKLRQMIYLDIQFLFKSHELDPHLEVALKNYHQTYKKLMTKAILKQPFNQSDLRDLEKLMAAPPEITIEAKDGKLLVSEALPPIILNRLAKGIVDVANGDKDIRICAADDCDLAFVPKRKDHKFHSRSCAQRTYRKIAKEEKERNANT